MTKDCIELSTEVETEGEQIVNIATFRSLHEASTEVETNETPIVDTRAAQPINKTSTKRTRTLSTSNSRGTARQKALGILRKNPQMTPSELAKRAGITRQYASKLLAEQA